MLVFQYSAYFRNHLNTRITLYSTVVSTGVNLFFDFSLVYGAFGPPCLGTAGAAWGSVIGLAAGVPVYQLAYYKKRFPAVTLLTDSANFLTAKAMAGKILCLFPSLFGQELLEGTIFTCVISTVAARLGTEQMAMYNLLDTAVNAIGLPVYAYATATEPFCQGHGGSQTLSEKRTSADFLHLDARVYKKNPLTGARFSGFFFHILFNRQS